MSLWLVDRTRISLGTDHCQMARYYGFHYGGWGIQLAKPPLEPNIGIAVHEILGADLANGGADPTDVCGAWKERLVAICQKRQETPHTVQEAWHLMTALAYGWGVMFNAWLSENFDVVAIEKEFLLELDDGRIGLMARPDLLLRAKQTKALSILDWKTMSSFNADSTPAQYRESVQLSLMTAAVEAAMHEPVESYWIAGLVKGGKKHFEMDKGETRTPEKRYFSDLCYANPPQAPFRNNWTTNGYWYKKAPVWEHMTAPEWVDTLKREQPEILRNTFPMLGPFQRQTHMIPQALRMLVGSENRWIRALWSLAETDEPLDVALDAALDRSYGNCTSFYGEECPYFSLCYKLKGSEDPIGSGLYRVRRPHHEPEQKAMIASGMQLPPEAWE